MDWITHAAVGAAVGEVMLGRRMGNRALAWGALCGIMPDLLDALFLPLLSTTNRLALHRGASHSLVLLVLLSLLLPRALVRVWQPHKVTTRQAGWFVAAGWGTQLLVDCLGGIGPQFLWPYPAAPPALDLLGEGDGWLAVPLVVSLVSLTWLRSKKQQAARRRRWWWGVGLAGAYVALAVAAKWAAAAGFAADLTRRGITCERRMESPAPWNILLWRGMADRGDEIWVGYRSVFEWHSTPVRWTIYPRDRAAFAKVAAAREAKQVAAFAKGWWIARSNKTGAWLADLRGGECLLWGERKGMVDTRFKRAWQFEPNAAGDPLRPIIPQPRTPGDMTRRMLLRTLGRHDAWDAQPRLAGVPGAFPELLQIE